MQTVGDHLEIANANAVTLVFTNATSFRKYHDISGDPVSAVRSTLDQALKKSYDKLRERHIADFRALFSRVQLQLGPAHSNSSDQPMDERIHNFAETDDPVLLALYFEFGRYLLYFVVTARRASGKSAGHLERSDVAAVEQQMDNEHQSPDELLAG